jgi:hypothetical protein
LTQQANELLDRASSNRPSSATTGDDASGTFALLFPLAANHESAIAMASQWHCNHEQEQEQEQEQ